MAEKDLVAIGEVGRILGVSRQRADVISQTDPDFPAVANEGVLVPHQATFARFTSSRSVLS